jgi:hypothetical protein
MGVGGILYLNNKAYVEAGFLVWADEPAFVAVAKDRFGCGWVKGSVWVFGFSASRRDPLVIIEKSLLASRGRRASRSERRIPVGATFCEKLLSVDVVDRGESMNLSR